MADERKSEEEPRVRVVDKRRINMDETAQAQAQTMPPPAQEAAPSEPASSAQKKRQEGEEVEPKDLPLISVADLMRIFMLELQTRAWIHMGLIANPQTNLIVKDLPEARLAIDCIAVLVDKLSPSLPAAEHEELKRMLADLRLNFVQQSG